MMMLVLVCGWRVLRRGVAVDQQKAHTQACRADNPRPIEMRNS